MHTHQYSALPNRPLLPHLHLRMFRSPVCSACGCRTSMQTTCWACRSCCPTARQPPNRCSWLAPGRCAAGWSMCRLCTRAGGWRSSTAGRGKQLMRKGAWVRTTALTSSLSCRPCSCLRGRGRRTAAMTLLLQLGYASHKAGSTKLLGTCVSAQLPSRSAFDSQRPPQAPGSKLCQQQQEQRERLAGALGLVCWRSVPVQHCRDAWGLVIEHRCGWKLVYSGVWVWSGCCGCCVTAHG